MVPIIGVKEHALERYGLPVWAIEIVHVGFSVGGTERLIFDIYVFHQLKFVENMVVDSDGFLLWLGPIWGLNAGAIIMVGPQGIIVRLASENLTGNGIGHLVNGVAKIGADSNG